MKIRDKFIFLVTLIVFVGLVSAVPQTFNFHGRLLDSGGSPLSGTYEMNFSLYDVVSGGSALWTDLLSVTTDSEGVYNVILEDIDLDFSQQYYLGFSVGGETEMSPRMNLTSNPYTFRANVSDYLVSTNSYEMANLTLSQKISFAFGEMIDNIVDGWIRVTGGLNVTGGMSVDSNTFYVDSSNNRVGIGTVTPVGKLNVIGDVNATTNISSPMICLSGDCQTSWGAAISGSGGWNDTGTVVSLVTSTDSINASTLYVDNTNNRVGVGITSPLDKFVVDNGNIAIDNGFGYKIGDVGGDDLIGTLKNTGGVFSLLADSTRDIQLGSASYPSSIFVEGTNGQVGIGTVNPGRRLDVYETAGTPNIRLSVDDSADNWMDLYATKLNMNRATASNAGFDFITTNSGSWGATGGYIRFMPDNTEAMRIDVGGNVGIGTTSPGYKLEVNGSLNIANNEWLSAKDYAGTGVVNMFKVNEDNEIDVGGTLNIGTLSLSEDSGVVTLVNMPVSSSASAGTPESYVFRVDSENVMSVYAESDGAGGVQNKRVGIGTISPQNTLNVIGDGNFTTNISSPMICLDGDCQTSWGAAISGSGGWNDTGSVVELVSSSDNISGGTFFVDNTNSRVGIGTSTPAGKLHLKQSADTNNDGIIVQDTAGGNTGRLWMNGSTFRIQKGTVAEGISISDAGNVGIGTTEPTRKLSVRSSNAGSIADFLHYTDASNYQGFYIDVNQTSDLVKLSSSGAASGGFQFLTGNTERMTILSGGNVGIGTDTPDKILTIKEDSANPIGEVVLRITGATSSNASLPADGLSRGIDFYATNDYQGRSGIYNHFNYAQTARSVLSFWTSGSSDYAEKMRIDGAGRIGINQTSPEATMHVMGDVIIEI